MVTIVGSPSLTVSKSVSITDNGDGVTGIGDVATYTIAVQNTGNVTLDNITVVDTLTDLNGNALNLDSGPSYSGSDQGSALGTLQPGETSNYTAFYMIDQIVMDNGGLVNVATATNGTVSDTSNTVTTTVVASPSLEVTKIASVSDDGDGITGANDVINYTIFIKNTGNVTLNQLNITDILTDGNGGALQISNPGGQVQYQGTSSGSQPGTIVPNEVQTYNAIYVISSDAASTTSVINRVEVTASSPGQTNNVSDTSDDGDDGDGNMIDDPTVIEMSTSSTTVEIQPFPLIKIEKSAIVNDNNGNGTNDFGDEIIYTITATNIGNVPLTSLNLNDVLTDGNGNPLSLSTSLTYIGGTSGSTSLSIVPTGVVTYRVRYVIDQQAVDSGSIINVVNATASSPNGTNDVSDSSDDPNTPQPDDATIVYTIFQPEINVTKTSNVSDTNNNGKTDQGDIINYSITIQNTGETTLRDINLTDTLTDFSNIPLQLNSSPVFESSSNGSSPTLLLVGGTLNYSASYTISQEAFDSGGVRNSILATASSPRNNGDVSDVSDDGLNDGNNLDDPTEEIFIHNPSITVSKSVNVIDDGDNKNDKGDILQYTIEIKNTGDVTLNDLSIEDTFSDINNNTLDLDLGPIFSGSSMGSPEGVIKVGEIATYTALYVIKQPAIDAGGVKNFAEITISSPGQTDNLIVVSDDPNTNLIDDPTITTISVSPSLEVTKTASVTDNNSNGLTDQGDQIVYTISIVNNGELTLTNVNLTDSLTDGDGNQLNLTNGPYFISSSLGSNTTLGTIKVGEILTYEALYIIQGNTISSGSIINSIFVSANSPGNINDVNDVSDDGDDSDGNSEDDPTIVDITSEASINVTKSSQIVQNDDNNLNNVGDVIIYTIDIENTGTSTLTDISLVDVFVDGNENNLVLENGLVFNSVTANSTSSVLAPSAILSYVASFTIDQSAFDSGSIFNQVTVSASSTFGTVTDQSDNGIDNDGELNNDPTIVNTAELEVTKVGNIVDVNSNGVTDIGDQVVFNITLQNTGSISLTSISLIDSMNDADQRVINLDSPPLFIQATAGSSTSTLLIGGILTYTATYTLDQLTINSGSVSNSIVANASNVSNTLVVSDTSDDGDDSDGNTYNDPTVISFTPAKSLEVTKLATVNDLNSNNVNDTGDQIIYTIEIRNRSNVTLTGLNLSDTLRDGNNIIVNLDNGPYYISSSLGSIQGTIQPGEIVTYRADYIITNSVALTGRLENSATATASSPNNTNDVSDVSDDPLTPQLNDPTVVVLTSPQPSIEVTKTATSTDNNGNGLVDSGDLINYTISVENNGALELNSLTINDNITDGNGLPLSLTSNPIYNSSTHVNQIGTLQPGEVETYNATYLITNASAVTGQIENSVTVTASSPGQTNNVNDISDDGDDFDGNLIDDPTVIILDLAQGDASLEVTKTAEVTDNGDEEVGMGDIITYNITVANTGSSVLTNISIIDQLSDGDGNDLALSNGPFFSGSSMNSSNETLMPGEIANYIAFYIIEQSASETGKIVNSVIASADTVSNSTISDVSDDGDDSDGNTTNDPTEVFIAPDPSIEAVKTAQITDNGDEIVGEGDIITYTITVTNTGNITLSDIKVEDSLTDGNGNSLTLSNGPFFSGSSLGSNNGILQVSESATYIGFYIIESKAALTSGIFNSVKVIASSPGFTDNVFDVSDDGDDSDGNTTDDPTEVLISSAPELEVTKIAEVDDINQDEETGPGDIINYTITIENKGNITITGISIIDTMIDGNGRSLSLTSGPKFVSSSEDSPKGILLPGEVATYTATYRILERDLESDFIENSALAVGSSPENQDDVTDVSDDGIDDDDNTQDDPTIVEISYIPPYFEIFNLVTSNQDGLNDYFKIAGIENFPDNNVKIYNRWGVLVYEVDNYGNSSQSQNVFKGFSAGRITINKGVRLPYGTYYYLIEFKGENPGSKTYSGYLYLN